MVICIIKEHTTLPPDSKLKYYLAKHVLPWIKTKPVIVQEYK